MHAPGARKSDWTKQAVAKRAKMTPTTYGRIEKGGHTRTRKLRDIAEILEVPIDAVLMPGAHSRIGDSRQKELIAEVLRDTFAKPSTQDSTVDAAVQATLHDAAMRTAEADAEAKRAAEAAKAKRIKKPRRK